MSTPLGRWCQGCRRLVSASIWLTKQAPPTKPAVNVKSRQPTPTANIKPERRTGYTRGDTTLSDASRAFSRTGPSVAPMNIIPTLPRHKVLRNRLDSATQLQIAKKKLPEPINVEHVEVFEATAELLVASDRIPERGTDNDMLDRLFGTLGSSERQTLVRSMMNKSGEPLAVVWLS